MRSQGEEGEGFYYTHTITYSIGALSSAAAAAARDINLLLAARPRLRTAGRGPRRGGGGGGGRRRREGGRGRKGVQSDRETASLFLGPEPEGYASRERVFPPLLCGKNWKWPTLGLEVKLSVCWSLVRPSEEEERSVYKVDRVKPFHQAELVDPKESSTLFLHFRENIGFPSTLFPFSVSGTSFKYRRHPFPFPT